MNDDVETKADRWVRRIAAVALWVGGTTLLFLALSIVGSALARTLGWVIVGGSEIVDVAVIVVASTALVAGTAAGSHPSVHILTEYLSARRQILLKVVTSVLSCGFFLLLAYGSMRVLISYAGLGEYTQLLHINITPFRAIWVFALLATCMLLLLRVSSIRRGKDSET